MSFTWQVHKVSDEALESILFLSDVVSKKSKVNPFSPYKSALFISDLLAAFLTFGLGSWITGLGFFEKGNLSYSIVLLAFSFVIIAFFASFNLYNYHIIYFKRNHLTSLFKSFFWSLVTFAIIAFLYTFPNLFGGISLITGLFFFTS